MPRTTKTTTSKTGTAPTKAKAAPNGLSAADKLRTALRRHPESTARELAEFAGIGASTATKILAAWADSGDAVRLPGEDTGGRKPSARWAPPEPAEPAPAAPQRVKGAPRHTKADTANTTAATTTVTPPSGRLPKWALHGLVEDFLAEPDRRGNAYTAGEIGRKLVRSAGAVRNALDKLTDKGAVVLTQEEPRRYQLAAD